MCKDQEKMLDQRCLAKHLSISERTLERWRSEKQGPPYVQLVQGGAVRYRMHDVEQWLEQQAVIPKRTAAIVNDVPGPVSTWQTMESRKSLRSVK